MKIREELNNVENKNGITLIALIITIIIMLILAGVVISLTLGENGIFNTAKYAVAKTKEETAREKLELVLADLQTKKYTDIENYDENGYINNYLINEGMSVEGNIVTVDGYKFEIDRSVPQIKTNLGKGEENKEIKITTNIEYSEDYTSANIKIKVDYEGEIAKVQVNGKDVEKVNDEYILKDISKNGTYTILVKDKNDGYKIVSEDITEILVEINTVADLQKFQKRVNSGITYEGKTINLVASLKLGNICGEDVNGQKVSFEPIGNYGTDKTHIFKGTFNGNYHTIDYLYIDTDKDYQGLFGYTDGATIKNLVIGEHSKITGKNQLGGIAGYITNTTIQNCGNNADITASNGWSGGVAGGCENNSNIIGSYNKGNVTTDSKERYIGGITGSYGSSASSNAGIKYCYNKGNVSGGNRIGGICGAGITYARIYNCYNIGTIDNYNTTYSETGGIVGIQRMCGDTKYCYNLGTVNNESRGIDTGGICGYNTAINGKKEEASVINYCYNSSRISSNGTNVGGICGENTNYCTIQNSYILAGITVKDVTTKLGSTDGIIGLDEGRSSNNEVLQNMPTVYEVVNANENGLNNGESNYWSKTAYSNANLQTPKLKWESNVK